jgi:hypothetical protein
MVRVRVDGFIEPCIPTRAASRASKHGRPGMSAEPTISELEKRIAVVRQNIAGLIEQAAAFSGAGDEARAAKTGSPNKSRSLPG